MSRRGARLAVAVLFAIALGAASWQYRSAERALRTQAAAAEGFEREARGALDAVAGLRAAQQAYVAVGQGTEYWTARVSGTIASLKSRLGELKRQASTAGAGVRLDAAGAAVDDFARMDRRAREYASSDQRLLASDLIFADGFEMTRAIASEIEGALALERSGRSRSAARLAFQQQILVAGVAGLALFFMFILAFAAGGQRAPRPEPASASPSLRLQEEPDDISPAADTSTPVAAAGRAVREVPPEPAPVVDLAFMADLCADLARVTDTRQVPALVARAAALLDATGIVLWIADPDGRELIPTVAYGYPPAAVSRLVSIPHDADNATAAAFREQKVHTVNGDVLTSGAIAAPLVAPGGCVGVMAAEVRHERERRAEVRAAAAIFAAQLATLIGITPAAQPRARAN